MSDRTGAGCSAAIVVLLMTMIVTVWAGFFTTLGVVWALRWMGVMP